MAAPGQGGRYAASSGASRRSTAALGNAKSPPSRVVQLARVATAKLAAFEFEGVLDTYRSALDLDRDLTDVWFGMALLHTQRGDAGGAQAAAREGLKRNASAAQKGFLAAIEVWAAPYAHERTSTSSPP